jgi:protein-tyrosine phosphatase
VILNQIFPRLFLGTCPIGAADIDRLRDEMGITAGLNLQTDEELVSRGIDWGTIQAFCAARGIVTRRVRLADDHPDQLQKLLPLCVDVLGRLMRDGHSVYVHCNAGTNRAPTVVTAYLSWVEGWELGSAVRHVMQGRSCSPSIPTILSTAKGRMLEPCAAG